MGQTDYVVRFTGQDNLTSTVNKVKQDLQDVGKAGDSALDKINDRFNRIINSSAPLKRQLRDIQALMAQMNNQGLGNTDKYNEMAQAAGKIKDAISDAAEATQRFASDTMNLQAGIQAMQGLAAAGAVATGTMGLLGTKNDEVTQAILKVQSAMAILNGIQQISNVLNKDSVLMLKMKKIFTAANTQATNANTTSTIANTAAQKASTTAQNAWNRAKAIGKAMFGDFTGLLILGVSALGAYSIATSDATEEDEKRTKALEREKEIQKSYYDTLNENLTKSISSYNQLKFEYSALRTEQEKTEWIKENSKAFDDLGLSVISVADADNVLLSGNANIVQSFKLRAQMAALAAKYQNIYNKALEGAPVAGDKLSQEEIEKEFGKYGSVYYTQNYGGLFGNSKKGGTLTKKGEELLQSRALNKAEQEANSVLKEIENKQKELDKLRNNTPTIKKPTTTTPTTRTTTNKNVTTTTNTDSYEKDKATLQDNYNKKLIDEITYKKELANLEKSHLDKLLKAGTATQADVDRYAAALKASAQMEIQKHYSEELNTLEKKRKDGMISEIEYAESYSSIMQSIYNDNVKIGTATDEMVQNYKSAVNEANKLKGALDLIEEFNKIDTKPKSNTSSFNKAIGSTVKSDSLEGIKQQMDFNDGLIEQLTLLIAKYKELGITGGDAFDAVVNKLQKVQKEQDNLSERATEINKQQKDFEEQGEKVNAYSEGIRNLGSVFGGLAGAMEESTAQWLNFAGAAASAVAEIIPQIQKLIIAKNAEALASGTAEGAKMPFPYNLAAIASIIATIVSVFASLPKFAEGGIVGGSNMFGDKILARVNSGEMILNGKQQRRLFDAINNGDLGGVSSPTVNFKIKGSDLVGTLKNYGKIQSKVGKGITL